MAERVRSKTTIEKLPQIDVGSVFNAEYYHNGCGPIPYERNETFLAFFGGIAEAINVTLRPETVFDAGCALGMLVESLWDRGVPAWGVDISEFAIEHVRRDMRPYCRVASLTEPIEGKYSLVTCIEVLEHLPPSETESAIANITAISDTILFSSSPSDFAEATHYNVQPVLAWLQQFQQHEFEPDVTFDASFLTPHAFLLRRSRRRLRNDLQTLFSAHLGLRSLIAERKNALAAVVADRDAIAAEGNRVVALLREAEAEGKRQAAAIAEYEATLAEREHAIDAIVAEKEAIAAEGNHVVALLREAEAEGKRQAATIAEYEATLAERGQALEAIAHENDALVAERDQAVETVSNERDHLAVLLQQAKAGKARLEELLETSRKESAKAIEATETRIVEREAQLAEIERAYRQAMSEIRDLHGSLHSAIDNEARAAAEVAGSRTRLDELTEHLHAARAQVASMQDENLHANHRTQVARQKYEVRQMQWKACSSALIAQLGKAQRHYESLLGEYQRVHDSNRRMLVAAQEDVERVEELTRLISSSAFWKIKMWLRRGRS